MDIKQFVRTKLSSTDPEDIRLAHLLCQDLGLPAPSPDPDLVPYYFSYRHGRLELTERSGNITTSVDFLSDTHRYRYRHDRRIDQHLTRAVGIKRGIRPTICDATAGFGMDSFVFSTFGCSVTMIERSPIVWALLRDGLKRAGCDPTLGRLISEKLTLEFGDAKEILTRQNRMYDTIYLDPMFPMRKKSALNKQNMRILKTLVGEDIDQEELLECTLEFASSRVVVKRPVAAPAIKSTGLSYQVKGSSNRYDIYLRPHL